MFPLNGQRHQEKTRGRVSAGAGDLARNSRKMNLEQKSDRENRVFSDFNQATYPRYPLNRLFFAE